VAVFIFQAEDGIRDSSVTGVQTCALPILNVLQPIPDAPADISTDTDRQAQTIILRHIHQAFPDDALCAEETIADFANVATSGQRSEERRVGKEGWRAERVGGG